MTMKCLFGARQYRLGIKVVLNTEEVDEMQLVNYN